MIDVWAQLGVSAIVARLWSYHRLYDDLLIVIPVIANYRTTVRGDLTQNQRLAADVLLFVSWLALLNPGFFLNSPYPYGTLSGQAR